MTFTINQRTACVLAVLACCLAARALAADPAPPGTADAAALFQQAYEQAAGQRSAAPLGPMLDEHFSAVLIVLGGGGQQGQVSVTGAAALDSYFSDLKALIGNGTYTLHVQPDGPADDAGDMATAHGTIERGIVTGQGAEYRLTTLWTAAFRKHAGQWRLLRLHESMDPLNNPLIIRVKHDALVRGSFVALLAGVVLGWLFRGLFPKKTTLN